MTSVLSSFFSRDPRNSFQYDIPNDSFTRIKGIFLGNSFKKSEPNEKATCLWSNGFNSTLKLQAQKLKTLRHPNVLTYLDFLEVESGLYLITESCEPLEYYFNRVKLTDAQKELFVSWGFYQILNCLKFLHNEVKILQNNLKESIFITGSGDWKLSGFHDTKPFSSPQTDLNDLALIAWQIFNEFSNNDNSSKKLLTKIPNRLQLFYKKLSSKGKVFTAEDLITECRSAGGFMKNKFVDTLLFLDEFQLKDSNEKQTFFMHLKDNLDIFPDDVAKRKILPKLIHTYEYGDAGSYILVPMFKLGRLLDEEEYQYRIVPCLVKLFSSSDRTTRVKLLEKIDEFGQHLKAEVINESIYGNLVMGFLDTNPAVRESTVKAMVSIAEKLNYHNLNTDLMKYLARLQGSDEQPGIRTNTTICLGKIGCYIDPSHRQRILISAFTRAIKDPFSPARMAGVLALSATQQYYSLAEVATKILPSLAPLTIDPEKQVRNQGFKSLKGFLEKLEKASENPEILPELEAQVKAGGRNGLLANEKVPQWAGWALKALSGKFYKSSTHSVPTNSATTSSTTTSNNEMTTSTANIQKSNTFSALSTPITHCKDIWNIKSTNKEETASTDKWETLSKTSSANGRNASDILDGWGDIEEDEDNFDTKTTTTSKTKDVKSSFIKEASINKKFNVDDDLFFDADDKSNDGWNDDFVDFSVPNNNSTQSTKKDISSLKIENDDWSATSSEKTGSLKCLPTLNVKKSQQRRAVKILTNNSSNVGVKSNSGPMKLGAKKIKSTTPNTKVIDDLERDLLG